MKTLTLSFLFLASLASSQTHAQVHFNGWVDEVVIGGPGASVGQEARDLCLSVIATEEGTQVLVEDITDCTWARRLSRLIGRRVEFWARYADPLEEDFRPALKTLMGPEALYFISQPE